MTGWRRADWLEQLAAAELSPGPVLTALALADMADADGVAAPGLARLAEASGCSVSTAYGRTIRLLIAGVIVRDGKTTTAQGQLNRYRLVIPVIDDVGQAVPGGFS